MPYGKSRLGKNFDRTKMVVATIINIIFASMVAMFYSVLFYAERKDEQYLPAKIFAIAIISAIGAYEIAGLLILIHPYTCWFGMGVVFLYFVDEYRTDIRYKM